MLLGLANYGENGTQSSLSSFDYEINQVKKGSELPDIFSKIDYVGDGCLGRELVSESKNAGAILQKKGTWICDLWSEDNIEQIASGWKKWVEENIIDPSNIFRIELQFWVVSYRCIHNSLEHSYISHEKAIYSLLGSLI